MFLFSYGIFFCTNFIFDLFINMVNIARALSIIVCIYNYMYYVLSDGDDIKMMRGKIIVLIDLIYY